MTTLERLVAAGKIVVVADHGTWTYVREAWVGTLQPCPVLAVEVLNGWPVIYRTDGNAATDSIYLEGEPLTGIPHFTVTFSRAFSSRPGQGVRQTTKEVTVIRHEGFHWNRGVQRIEASLKLEEEAPQLTEAGYEEQLAALREAIRPRLPELTARCEQGSILRERQSRDEEVARLVNEHVPENGPSGISREHYERVCASLGLPPWSDSSCESSSVHFSWETGPYDDISAQDKFVIVLAHLRGDRVRAEREARTPSVSALPEDRIPDSCAKCGQTGFHGEHPFSTLAGSGLCDDCL